MRKIYLFMFSHTYGRTYAFHVQTYWKIFSLKNIGSIYFHFVREIVQLGCV